MSPGHHEATAGRGTGAHPTAWHRGAPSIPGPPPHPHEPPLGEAQAAHVPLPITSPHRTPPFRPSRPGAARCITPNGPSVPRPETGTERTPGGGPAHVLSSVPCAPLPPTPQPHSEPLGDPGPGVAASGCPDGPAPRTPLCRPCPAIPPRLPAPHRPCPAAAAALTSTIAAVRAALPRPAGRVPSRRRALAGQRGDGEAPAHGPAATSGSGLRLPRVRGRRRALTGVLVPAAPPAAPPRSARRCPARPDGTDRGPPRPAPPRPTPRCPAAAAARGCWDRASVPGGRRDGTGRDATGRDGIGAALRRTFLPTASAEPRPLITALVLRPPRPATDPGSPRAAGLEGVGAAGLRLGARRTSRSREPGTGGWGWRCILLWGMAAAPPAAPLLPAPPQARSPRLLSTRKPLPKDGLYYKGAGEGWQSRR